jgi:hypothetical protein
MPAPAFLSLFQLVVTGAGGLASWIPVVRALRIV